MGYVMDPVLGWVFAPPGVSGILLRSGETVEVRPTTEVVRSRSVKPRIVRVAAKDRSRRAAFAAVVVMTTEFAGPKSMALLDAAPGGDDDVNDESKPGEDDGDLDPLLFDELTKEDLVDLAPGSYVLLRCIDPPGTKRRRRTRLPGRRGASDRKRPKSLKRTQR